MVTFAPARVGAGGAWIAGTGSRTGPIEAKGMGWNPLTEAVELWLGLRLRSRLAASSKSGGPFGLLSAMEV